MQRMTPEEAGLPADGRVLVKIAITSPLLGETWVARGGPSADRALEDSRSDTVGALRADTREALAALARAAAAAVEALTETKED